MYQLSWRDLTDDLMAYAQGSRIFSDVVSHKGNSLPVWVWPVHRLTYGIQVACRLSCMYPLNSIFPAYRFFIDENVEKGGCFIMPGESNLPRIAHPSYTNTIVFHIPEFFTTEGVILSDIILSLPAIVSRHMSEIKEVFSEGDK